MDTLTQGLLGAVTAQLGFRQRIGPSATAVAALAAITPDLDVLAGPVLALAGAEPDGLVHLEAHRGITHSLLAAPLMALVMAALWWIARRRAAGQAHALRPPPAPRFGILYACLLAAVLSHPLLDWCTSYGTQLLAPLTSARYAADAVGIIDIFYTPILAATLLAAWVVRKASRSTAARATLAIGWAGFLLSVGYLAGGRLMHDRAVERVRGLVPAADAVRRADAYPTIGTIFLWRAVAETDRGWYVARVRPLGPAGAQPPARFVPRVDNPWVRKALASPAAERYAWFAMDRVRAAYDERDGLRVAELHDMRYGWPLDSPESLWPLRVTMDEDGQVLGAERVRSHQRGGPWDMARRIWRDLWSDGNKVAG